MTGAEELGGKLLEGVSRSFFLTLKALPQGLREPLSLAYLLARAADTMADTVSVPSQARMECLREFDRLVQCDTRDPDTESALSARLKRDFAPLQEDVHEATLLERLPALFEAFRSAPRRQADAMRGVLAPIVQGQLLDIGRFPVDGQLRALATAAELDDYTWLVAGCVGEFWTTLCAEEVPGVFAPEVTQPQMIEWGIRYGKGLQLVNILRDTGKDLRMGRCYFPDEELAALGIALTEVKADPSMLRPALRPWIEACRAHLACGVRYLDALQHKRLLYATALPLLLGIRTLALIEQADWPTLMQGVKISRSEVSKILLEAGLATLRKGGIHRLADRLAEAR